MLPKTFILFAVSCITIVTAAGLDDNILEDFSAVKGNGNYIFHLSPETDVKTFVPDFINGATHAVIQSMGGDKVKVQKNKIVKLGTDEEQVQVIDVYSIADSFKGLTVKFENASVIEDLTKEFSKNILRVFPDQDIKFDLPKPKNKKRFLARSRSQKRAERKGNYDPDTFDKFGVPDVLELENTTLSKRAATSYSRQTGAQWNLVRISQHRRDLSQPYIYDSNAGSGAYVYVVDDGMRTDHSDFGGRAQWGWSSYSGISQYGTGHGTHVGGIIGGSTYGVAKKANLVAVQVLDDTGSGSVSSIISGLQWVVNNAKKGRSVVNMSLGMKTNGVPSSTLSAFNSAIDAVVSSGIPVFVAAGNSGSDACYVSPANNKNVFTVGATDKSDAMTDYSCYGSCVQILAPGDNILSTYVNSRTSTTTMSGTSMASPHAAGVGALLLSQAAGTSPSSIYSQMSSLATSNAVTSITGRTVNELLHNGQQSTSA
ncbi:hypothetical protein G6F57_001007 [Rhizopus arrhizus]|uniref:Peptidase S8/S53 domain-containing protein n=1 Tax=Rhizopus oryzae TaxID=64495 RepID=A0A9P7BWP7_RHIOR|nr:hypothetical protein G6F23_004852 [Rhizopus arrhizus]KAG1412496.1 hypothetical protein G6F58_007987 [Rhizopus delemar]KAG0769162.1 hypothetical protein G6F24_001319 [Rhizopus arrhizus]KAG0782259.1 hypothetical protein G6F22_009190 [Rhizopus arrhizus]KAG0795573.1 hypothetical protein G6F21_002008 [Rhizopus arrhizus]